MLTLRCWPWLQSFQGLSGGVGERSLFSLLVAVNRLLTLTLLFTIGINSLTHEISIGGTPTWQLALLRGRTLEGHRGGTEEIPEPSVTSSQKGYPISSATCSLWKQVTKSAHIQGESFIQASISRGESLGTPLETAYHRLQSSLYTSGTQLSLLLYEL